MSNIQRFGGRRLRGFGMVGPIQEPKWKFPLASSIILADPSRQLRFSDWTKWRDLQIGVAEPRLSRSGPTPAGDANCCELGLPAVAYRRSTHEETFWLRIG